MRAQGAAAHRSPRGGLPCLLDEKSRQIVDEQAKLARRQGPPMLASEPDQMHRQHEGDRQRCRGSGYDANGFKRHIVLDCRMDERLMPVLLGCSLRARSLTDSSLTRRTCSTFASPTSLNSFLIRSMSSAFTCMVHTGILRSRSTMILFAPACKTRKTAMQTPYTGSRTRLNDTMMPKTTSTASKTTNIANTAFSSITNALLILVEASRVTYDYYRTHRRSAARAITDNTDTFGGRGTIGALCCLRAGIIAQNLLF